MTTADIFKIMFLLTVLPALSWCSAPAHADDQLTAVKQKLSKTLTDMTTMQSPVLRGIRKIYFNCSTLSPLAVKEFSEGMQQLGIPVEYHGGTPAADPYLGLVTISATENGSETDIDLQLLQEVTLVRMPTQYFRAVTYIDHASAPTQNSPQAVREVVSRLVINYLKVNSTPAK